MVNYVPYFGDLYEMEQKKLINLKNFKTMIDGTANVLLRQRLDKFLEHIARGQKDGVIEVSPEHYQIYNDFKVNGIKMRWPRW